MIIETQEEWNAVLAGCGCCEMPVCPVPGVDIQSKEFADHACGAYGTMIANPNYGPWDPVPCAVACQTFKTVTRTHVRTWRGTETTVFTRVYARSGDYCSSSYTEETTGSDGGLPAIPTPISTTKTQSGSASSYTYQVVKTGERLGDPWTITDTLVFSDPVSESELLADIRATANSKTYGATFENYSILSITSFCDCVGSSTPASAKCAFGRNRWVVPDTWEGSYFKITWDVVFFPEGGDPVAVSTDNTWEWAGPGDPEDPDSWKSGWYEIPAPVQLGENRIVNIRFLCYKSTMLGVKPQITGEAVDLP